MCQAPETSVASLLLSLNVPSAEASRANVVTSARQARATTIRAEKRGLRRRTGRGADLGSRAMERMAARKVPQRAAQTKGSPPPLGSGGSLTPWAAQGTLRTQREHHFSADSRVSSRNLNGV